MIKKLLFLALLAVPCFAQQGGFIGTNGGGGTTALLPGSPNLVYSFVATGDQAGTTIHDISGSGNNATFSATGTTWTGTGLSFAQTAAGATIPTAAVQDETYCAAFLAPTFSAGYVPNNPGNSIMTLAATTSLWSYSDYNPNGPTQDRMGAYTNNTANSATILYNSPTGLHVACWLQGLTGNSTHDRLFIDGTEPPYNVQTGQSGLYNTSGSWILGVNSQMTFYYFAGWATQLTTAQVQQASFSILSSLNSRGVQTKPSQIPISSTRLIVEGDSISCCGGVGTTLWWPTDISGEISALYTINNESITGTEALSMGENAGWLDTPQCASGTQKSAVIIFGGTNDITVFGASGQTAFNNIMNGVTALENAGCQVGVGTMISRTGQDAGKDALNPLIRAGAPAGGYFVVDFASDSHLGCDGCNSNATYFAVDDVHPTNAGQALMAQDAANAINAYGVGSASSANPTIYTANTVSMLSADRFATANDASATAWTLPDCLGVTGTQYQIVNIGAGTVTFSGKASEAITGGTTAVTGVTAIFQATLISQSAGGCGWQRVQ